MGNFFFDIIDEEGSFRDEEGGVFESDSEVQRQVVRILSDLIRDGAETRRNGTVTVSVRDAHGMQLFTGSASFAVTRSMR